MKPDPSRFQEHSDKHFNHAERIATSSEEWAAVAYFYSAYHAVKLAIAEDPVFDDLSELKKLDPNLMPDDRYPKQHQARRRQAGFGVNDLVQLLYPTHIRNYDRLHQSSNRVRYDCAKPVFELPQLRGWTVDIREAVTSGLMQASVI